MNVFVLANVFWQQFPKNRQFQAKLSIFENCWQNTTARTEMFTENQLRRNFALHLTSYLSITLSKILPHSSRTKSAKKLSVFGENDSRSLSNFLQTLIFWNFDHISRIYNQVNYRNIWFPKVIIILIMTGQVLFFHAFSEKDPYLNTVACNCLLTRLWRHEILN